MSKTNRSVHYITSIPNTVEGLKILADLREALKRKGIGTRVYGRCKHKRKVFEKNGRTYYKWNAENVKNDISLKSAEATDCYEWAVYFRPKRQRIVKPENVIKVPYPDDAFTKANEIMIDNLGQPEFLFMTDEVEEAAAR